LNGSDRGSLSRKKAIRVLFLNTRSALGADVAVHLTLINHLEQTGAEVFVVTNRNSEELAATLERLKSLPAERVRVMDLGHEAAASRTGLARMIGALRNTGALASLIRVAAFVRRNQIGVIHSTDRPRDAAFATLLAKLTRRKNVVHAHISWNDHFSRATRWALEQCSAVLAVSEFSRRTFEAAGLAPARLYVAHNATDTAVFDPARVPAGAFRRRLGLGADTPLIGIVARIMVWKGHMDLIEALAKVRKSVPGVNLAIVGKEDLRATGDGSDDFARRLRERIEALDLGDRVHWAGWCDDVPQVMRDLDVLAMPSWEEPFGLAVTEALAMETPVVGFAAGALPEIVTDEVEGLLAPPRDVDALAAALTRLLGDAELRRTMGARGRSRVLAAFTPRRQAEEVVAIYRSIIAPHATP
jgi:glycosyltransferase involved in cell wall biosynthesis